MSSDLGTLIKDLSQAIDQANQSYESIWSKIADCAKIVDPSSSTVDYATLKTISYNPQSEKACEICPQMQNGAAHLSGIITGCLSEVMKNPDDFEQWAIAGKCYMILGDFTNAYTAFSHVLRINPSVNDKILWYCIACSYQHFGLHEEAIKFFKNVGEVKPESPLYSDYHLRLALSYRTLGQLQKAANEFDLAAIVPPPNLMEDDITFQKCFSYSSGKNSDIAITEMRNLLKKYPNNLKLIQQFTWTLSFRNDDASLNEAMNMIEKHQEYVNDPMLMFVIARIAMKTSDMETAYHKYCRCIHDWCESPVFWCALGVLYFKNEQYQDALIAFQRTLYQKAEIVEAWLNLGLVFEIMDKIDSAIKIYTAGIQNCPNNSKLNERLSRFTNSQLTSSQKIEIEEIKESMYFSQVGDSHAQMIIRTPPPIPCSTISSDESIAKSIEKLRIPYESLFDNSK